MDFGQVEMVMKGVGGISVSKGQEGIYVLGGKSLFVCLLYRVANIFVLVIYVNKYFFSLFFLDICFGIVRVLRFIWKN